MIDIFKREEGLSCIPSIPEYMSIRAFPLFKVHYTHFQHAGNFFKLGVST